MRLRSPETPGTQRYNKQGEGGRHAGHMTPLLTEGLLAHDEAADHRFVGAPQSEAVSSQNYVKGLWEGNKDADKEGGAGPLHLLMLPSP